MKRIKKGFTIVELVIVIAVIAVLTAVLIPTFVHLSKKAGDSNDKTIVTNANIVLAAHEGTEGRNRSMSQAVKDVEEIGYHIPDIVTKNGNRIVWDRTTDRFVLLAEDGTTVLQKDPSKEVSTNPDDLFYAIEKLADRGTHNFAIYAKQAYEGPTSFTMPVSFDAGDTVDLETIDYDLGTAAADLLVSTNSEETTLTVNAPQAELEHVGLCGKEIIIAIKGSTFEDHGQIGYVEIESGHYVADSGANVKAVYATSENAVVDKQNGGVIGHSYGEEEDYTGASSKGNVTLEFNSDKQGVIDQAMADLDGDINPPEPAGAVEVTQTNYATIFTPENHNYIVTEDITIMVNPFMVPEGCDVELDLNGHNLMCNYTDFDMDLYYEHTSDDEFIYTVSCFTNRGTLSIIGEGTIGGENGWFGMINEGTLTLDGDQIIRGGRVGFAAYGIWVAFSPLSNKGTLNAEGYKYYNNNTAYDGYVSGKSAPWTFEKR